MGPTLAALGYLDDGKSPPSGQDVRRLLLVEIEWQDARSARYHAPSTFRPTWLLRLQMWRDPPYCTGTVEAVWLCSSCSRCGEAVAPTREETMDSSCRRFLGACLDSVAALGSRGGHRWRNCQDPGTLSGFGGDYPPPPGKKSTRAADCIV